MRRLIAPFGDEKSPHFFFERHHDDCRPQRPRTIKSSALNRHQSTRSASGERFARLANGRTALMATAVVSLSVGFAAGRSFIRRYSQSTKSFPLAYHGHAAKRKKALYSYASATSSPETPSRPRKRVGRSFTTHTLPFLRGARLGLGHALTT
jgi:hypothetical protein